MQKKSLCNENVVHLEKDGVEYIQFKNLLKYENMMVHCFTTRKGGISQGECTSLNLGFNRRDLRENVEENYKRVADTLGIQVENMVFSSQVHDNKIRQVDESDRGKGILRQSDIIGVDGLMTDKRQVALVTFYADCVPVFFLDPVKKVIAVTHSGWRGTVKEIAAEAVRMMTETYNCNPGDIETAVGPSISKCCFEVGKEVYEEFINKLKWSEAYCKQTGMEKWHIDLQGIIKESLMNSGVPEENINISGICTKCNRDIFFSHRGDCGKTGSLAAIMQLL